VGRKTPPHPAYPQWTTARYFQFLRSALRKLWLRWPPRSEALRAARKTVAGKRHKYEYLCAQCRKWYMQKEVEVDHIVPAGSLNSHDDLKGFVSRLLVSIKGLRVLCRPCHQEITNKEKNG